MLMPEICGFPGIRWRDCHFFSALLDIEGPIVVFVNGLLGMGGSDWSFVSFGLSPVFL